MLQDVQTRPNHPIQVPELREMSTLGSRIILVAIAAITALGVVLSFIAPMELTSIWLDVGTTDALLTALYIINWCGSPIEDDNDEY